MYPLFVNNIATLLYHPTNQVRTNAVMAAAENQRRQQNQPRTQPGLPSLHQHHHHSMNSSIGLPGPQHSLAPHPGSGRPVLDRAHTFPTPPTSASSVMGMGNPDGSYQWSPQGINTAQGGNPLSIDTGLSNSRSMPTTPASTPPGNSLQSMQQYQQNSQQPYDTSRQMYSAPPPQQSAYAQSTPGQQTMAHYQQQSNSYIKNEMGPPLVRSAGSEVEHHDVKNSNGMLHHNESQGHVNHAHGEDEGEHEHDPEYTHGNSTNYDANRTYSYANGSQVGSLAAEHGHVSPEMAGSPNHPASGRATPRTTTAPQPYYTQQQGYNTPPRVQPPSSNLYNVMSSERGTANGGDVYATQPDMTNSVSNGYAAAQQPVMNGVSGNNKRSRDDEDDRPESRGAEVDGLKRRKTIREGSISGATSYDRPVRAPSTITQRRR